MSGRRRREDRARSRGCFSDEQVVDFLDLAAIVSHPLHDIRNILRHGLVTQTGPKRRNEISRSAFDDAARTIIMVWMLKRVHYRGMD
jgi:hypothetical protein